jgi:hypothetical protein
MLMKPVFSDLTGQIVSSDNERRRLFLSILPRQLSRKDFLDNPARLHGFARTGRHSVERANRLSAGMFPVPGKET